MSNLNRAWYAARQEGHLSGNYLALHNTVVSVTLAVAGLAAGNLISLPVEYATYGLVLRLLWVVSLAATLVAFAGTAIGATVLAPRVPSIIDLLAPLLLGISECLMFGVIARQAQSISSPASIVEAWYFSLAAFGVASAISVERARAHIKAAAYDNDIDATITSYNRGLRADSGAASIIGVLGLAGGICSEVSPNWLYPVGHYALIGIVSLILVLGFVSHARARRRFHRIL